MYEYYTDNILESGILHVLNDLPRLRCSIGVCSLAFQLWTIFLYSRPIFFASLRMCQDNDKSPSWSRAKCLLDSFERLSTLDNLAPCGTPRSSGDRHVTTPVYIESTVDYFRNPMIIIEHISTTRTIDGCRQNCEWTTILDECRDNVCGEGGLENGNNLSSTINTIAIR